jgi:hypothetical protein
LKSTISEVLTTFGLMIFQKDQKGEYLKYNKDIKDTDLTQMFGFDIYSKKYFENDK